MRISDWSSDVCSSDLEEGDVIAGGTASFVDGKLVLTFEPGVASVNLDAIRVKLPQHSDNDFSIKIVTTTTEADDDGADALVATHETDATIVVKVDAVADPVTVTIDDESASGAEPCAREKERRGGT